MQDHLREEQRNSALADARIAVAKMYRERQGKKEKNEAFWKNYRDQLEKGNSNIGNGARHSAHRRIQAHKVC